MAQNQKIVEALTSLVESSRIANKTNLAILKRLESEHGANDNGELVAQFKKAMGSAKEPVLVPVRSGNSQQSSQRLVLSPKLDFAMRWLQANPQDAKRSGRDLEKSILTDGKTISYKWWNKAKKMV